MAAFAEEPAVSEAPESVSQSQPVAEERAPIRSVPIMKSITKSLEPEPEAAPVAPEPEPVAVVLTPPDPDRPKRAGWWSKAKSVISGH